MLWAGSLWKRMKRLLFKRLFCEPPARPLLRLQSTASTITASFVYQPPGPYNLGDTFELQARSGAPVVSAGT
jgi:hypothetical protein